MRLVVDGHLPIGHGAGDPCRLLGLDERIGRELERLFVQPRYLARRDVLYRAGDGFSALHIVRKGSLKTVMLAEDGREQIAGHHMAGDIVGLDGLGHAQHHCDAVALEPGEVSSLPFSRLDEIARDPGLMGALFHLMARDMRRNQNLIMLLGSMCAEERLATFLLDLSGRQQERGLAVSELRLSMTREEIACFLGLKLETVSRIFSRLHGERLLRVQGRAVTLMDMAGLRRVAGQAL